MRLPVLAGPADGASAAASSGPWRWIDAQGRGSCVPRPGYALYRRRVGRWVFAGESWVCGGCGALVVERTAQCPLCAAEREIGLRSG